MELNISHVFSAIGVIMAFGSAYLGIKLGVAELKAVQVSLKEVVAEMKATHKEQLNKLELRVERLEARIYHKE